MSLDLTVGIDVVQAEFLDEVPEESQNEIIQKFYYWDDSIHRVGWRYIVLLQKPGLKETEKFELAILPYFLIRFSQQENRQLYDEIERTIDETYKKRTLPNREGLIARLNEAAHEYREKVIPFSGMGESWNYVEQAE